MTSPSRQLNRLASGGTIDRAAPLSFTFDGRKYQGYAGDTLASALIANSVALVGRSFKYHRPRGILTAGPEEPNALVEMRTGARREPNTRATVAELYDGLVAESQNRWPSLAFDLMSVNNLAAPLIKAGFYYKTFMWPASFWEKVYEPLIRRAAGLGRAPTQEDPDTYERSHLFCDVLVIGSGPAGLMAALTATRGGARVVLCEQDFQLGGDLIGSAQTIDGISGANWLSKVAGELASLSDVRVLLRTTVFGLFDHGVCAAVERVGDHLPEPEPHTVRQRIWKIVARRIVLAAGAIERPLVFPGNDRPGIMMASAAQKYIERFAVLPGRRAVVVTSSDSGWQSVEALSDAGTHVEAVVDTREEIAPELRQCAAAIGAQVVAGGRVTGTAGRLRINSADVSAGGRTMTFVTDLLLMAGGWDPVVHLASHMGSKPRWEASIGAFVPDKLPPRVSVAGSAAGHFALSDVLADGLRAGANAVADMGFAVAVPSAPRVEDAGKTGTSAPIWVPGPKSFVDFQHDVTADDIKLAVHEGFRSIEHTKRYTTLGMATDQGKTSSVNGLAILASIDGRAIPEVGTTVYRPPYTPVAIGAIAGHERGKHFEPARLTPTHAWASELGATFVEAGAWYRAQWYPRAGETTWLESVNREVRTVRTAVGICDVSTLGKIEVVGPDAMRLLDLVYTRDIASMPVGRVRYGLMLREDGYVFDDGVAARLGPDRFMLTTTTVHAEQVLRHMEFCHHVVAPSLDVSCLLVTDKWAQIAIAGPRSRELVARVVDGNFDLSNESFPHMSAAALTVCGGTPARLLRVSFSGENAYELGVPADFGDTLARRLMQVGAPLDVAPYGTEAMGVLRIEKGHPAGGELNGHTTARDLGLGGLLSKKKDFIGRAFQSLPAFTDPDRRTLVAFAPIDKKQTLRAGSHLLALGAEPSTANDQGYLTSSMYSATLGHSIALGLLVRGPARIGERVRAYDPVRGGDIEVEVRPACSIDPQGERTRV